MFETPEPGDDSVSRAIDAAIANAALEDIHVTADERALIDTHQRGEITDGDFLERARAIAEHKARDDDG